MKESVFKSIVAEMIEENPLAIRAVLKILAIDFTDDVPTLAVTCENRPRLLVNLDFVKAHCATDQQVKAVICHEFLHVLLRHTEGRRSMSPRENLAMDAVINAVIHRQLGPDYSSMMSAYYAGADGLRKMLRPLTQGEFHLATNMGSHSQPPQWVQAWMALYSGRLVVDDIRDLAKDLWVEDSDVQLFLGNHQDIGEPLTGPIIDALNDSLRAMNGSGTWRYPRQRGVGAHSCEALFTAKDAVIAKWRKSAMEVLKKHLLPDRRARAQCFTNLPYRMPVLNSKDRRAFVRSIWDSFIPDAAWVASTPRSRGTAQVYLDVSGSMNAEMPHLVALLNRLRPYIRMPFWAFSDDVKPAVIERGQLRTESSSGTSMACVLEHLARTRPTAAVLVTDGFIEEVPAARVRQIGDIRLHAIVSRDGNPSLLARAGIPYTQLDRSPS